jgi:hypothetical protein
MLVRDRTRVISVRTIASVTKTICAWLAGFELPIQKDNSNERLAMTGTKLTCRAM